MAPFDGVLTRQWPHIESTLNIQMQLRHDSAKFVIGLALIAVRTSFMPEILGSLILELVFGDLLFDGDTVLTGVTA